MLGIDLWFLNAELAHAGTQSGRVHVQNHGGAIGALDAPVGEPEHPQQLDLQLRRQFAHLIIICT